MGNLGPMPGAGPEIWNLTDTPADPNRIDAGANGGLTVSHDRSVAESPFRLFAGTTGAGVIVLRR